MNNLHSKVKKATKRILETTNLQHSWVSGTSISNYLLKDPVIDWLKTYYNTYGLNNHRVTRSNGVRIKTKNRDTTSNVLMKNGCHFETKIYTDLIQKFGNDVVNLNALHDFTHEQKPIAFAKTLDEMQKKTPIILQAYIKSDKLKLEGITDILIRSDYINKLTKRQCIVPDNNSIHYMVIDIKWSNMSLCVDGKTIRNDGRFKAYKGQLLIYNIILGELQGYTPSQTFIMPKSWNIDKVGDEQWGQSCYDLLGVIDYANRDSSYVDETINAINWVRDVRTNGHGWSPLNPHIKEMCCNSCNQDDNWNSIKKDIMNETKDITQVWMLTADQRNIAFDKGIKRWDDKRCQSSLFMKDGVKSKVINEILKINQHELDKIKIGNVDNRFDWQHSSSRDFYIDYETISEAFIENSNMDITNGKISDGFIFMIGIGFENENGEFQHISFECEDYIPSEEARIITNLKNFIGDSYETRLFHWGHVEQTLMNSALSRHPSIHWVNYDTIKWVDMCSVFTKAPIVVKGSLTFKLKDIAKAMYANGLISTKWESGELENGLIAMQEAITYYHQDKNYKKMESIRRYNLIDCKVIWDIVKYLRTILNE